MIIYKEPSADGTIFKKEIYDGCTTLCNCYGACSVAESYSYGPNDEWYFATGCGSYHGVMTCGITPNKYICVIAKQYSHQTGCWKLNTPIFLNSNIFKFKSFELYSSSCSGLMCTYLTDGNCEYCLYAYSGVTNNCIDVTRNFIYNPQSCCMDIYIKCNTTNAQTNLQIDLTNWNVRNIILNYRNYLSASAGANCLRLQVYYQVNLKNFDNAEYIKLITQ